MSRFLKQIAVYFSLCFFFNSTVCQSFQKTYTKQQNTIPCFSKMSTVHFPHQMKRVGFWKITNHNWTKIKTFCFVVSKNSVNQLLKKVRLNVISWGLVLQLTHLSRLTWHLISCFICLIKKLLICHLYKTKNVKMSCFFVWYPVSYNCIQLGVVWLLLIRGQLPKTIQWEKKSPYLQIQRKY